MKKVTESPFHNSVSVFLILHLIGWLRSYAKCSKKGERCDASEHAGRLRGKRHIMLTSVYESSFKAI